MNKINRRMLSAIGAMLCLTPSIAAADDIAVGAHAQIDVDAKTNVISPANAVYLQLGPGDYEVTPVPVADGSLFDAWLAWPQTAGCDSNGENCDQGWMNQFRYIADEFGEIIARFVGRYATPAQALLARQADGPSAFGLCEAGAVGFYIRDLIPHDNKGGVSLRVTRLNDASQLPYCDADGDGVPNSDDLCPGEDDAQDADADGVPDGCDICPADPEIGCCGCS